MKNYIFLFLLLSVFFNKRSICQKEFNVSEIETKLDSAFDNNGILTGIGYITLNNDFENLRFGLWKEYYATGEIKGEGIFLLGRYIECKSGSVFWMYYNYKTGSWKYYHKNGIVKAQGTYETQRYNFPTTCKGGYEIIKQKAGKNWEFYYDNEKLAKENKEYIKEIEKIYFQVKS